MIESDCGALSSVGLTPALAQRAAGLEGNFPGARLVRVTEVHRESVRVHDGHADHTAHVLPRLARELAGEDGTLAVGDWALAQRDAHGALWLHVRVPPLSRRVPPPPPPHRASLLYLWSRGGTYGQPSCGADAMKPRL